MPKLMKVVVVMALAAVSVTGCGSATLMNVAGTSTGGAAGGGSGGQGGAAGHAPTGSGGGAGAAATGGSVGSGGVGGSGGSGGAGGNGGSGGGAGSVVATGGVSGSGGAGGTPATGGAGGAGAKSNGDACGAGSECKSTYCVDGYCCNSACSGQCQMCNVAGSPGTCAFITGTPRAGQPCSGSGSCAGTCGGTSATCVYPGASTSCGSPTCSNGTATAAGACNGSGTCSAGAITPCGSFACNTNACYTTCTSQAQCAANTICSGGACSACQSGQAVCGNSCATLASDGNNCGTCGHSCYGGACSSGQCQPVSVYSSTSSAFSMAVGSNRVYVLTRSTTGTTISYMPTNAPPGTTLTPFSTISGQGCGYLDPNPDPATGDLFMQCYPLDSSGNPTTNEYFRVVSATAGGAGTQLFQVGLNQSGSLPPYPSGTGLILWGEIDMPLVVRDAHTDGSNIGTIVTYPSTGPTLISLLAVDQTSAYVWAYSGTSGSVQVLNQVSLTTGATNTLISSFSSAGVLSDNSSVFWWLGGTGIYSVPKNMTTPTQTTVMTDSNLAVFGSVDATSIYYATQVDTVSGATGCSSYRVGRRPKAGGAETSMVDGTQNCVTDIKGDANVIAYATRGLACATTACTYTVLKVAK